MSRDFCRLVTARSQKYVSAMARRFFDALHDALKVADWSLKKACEEANVSYEQMKKFSQRSKVDPNASTSVDDAVKVANALGFTLDELLSDDTAKLRSEAADLWREMTDGERAILLAAARGQRDLGQPAD